MANSVALLVDAAHNLSDVLGLLLAWGAIILAKAATQPALYLWPGGFIDSAALVNGAFLLLATGGIAWEAIQRFARAGAGGGHYGDHRGGVGNCRQHRDGAPVHVGTQTLTAIRGAFLHWAADAIARWAWWSLKSASCTPDGCGSIP